MDTVQQDAFAMKELLEEGGDGLTGLARALLEAGARATGALDRAAEVVAAAGAGDVEGRRWDVELVAPSGAKPGSLRVVLPEA